MAEINIYVRGFRSCFTDKHLGLADKAGRNWEVLVFVDGQRDFNLLIK